MKPTTAFKCLLTLLATLALVAPALAQKTKAELQTEINTNYPDNNIGLITPTILRTTTMDQVNSWQQSPRVNAQSAASYTFTVADYGYLVTFNNATAVAVTLPQATGSFATWNATACNRGAGVVTITPAISTIAGLSTLVLATGQCQTIVSDGTNYQLMQANLPGGARERLTAARTYFVGTDGNDINCNGLTNVPDPGSGNTPRACRYQTTQKAWDVITQTLDQACKVVTIQVADGTYGAGIVSTAAPFGGCDSAGDVILTGNVANPQNVIFNVTTGVTAVFEFGTGTSAQTRVTLRNFECRNSVSGGSCISAWGAGVSVQFNNIRFGATNSAHIASQHGALVFDLQGAYAITGSAATHISAATGGQVYLDGDAITISNNPNFSTAFVSATDSAVVMAAGMTFTNSATVTGQRFSVGRNANVFTGGGGVNYFPGDAPGAIGGQGVYDGIPLGVGDGGTGLSVGNSGGLPYFNSGATMASSATLVANCIMVGGGAGAAPNTPPTTCPTASSTGVFAVANATEATSPTAASATFAGGIGSSKKIWSASRLLAGSSDPLTTAVGIGTIDAAANVSWQLGQASNAGLNFLWNFASPSSGAAAVISTFSYLNPIFMDASIIRFQTQSGFRTHFGGNVGIGADIPPDANLTINTNTNLTVAPGTGTLLHLVGADATVMRFVIDGFAQATAISPRRADGTLASKAAVNAGVQIFVLGAQTWDGSAYNTVTGLTMVTSEVQSTSAHGAELRFQTTPLGATTQVEAMRLQASGGLSVGGTTDPGIGVVSATKGMQVIATTVSGLPTCNAGRRGMRAFVTDQATAVAYKGAVTGGGAVNQGVLCDGTAWYQN